MSQTGISWKKRILGLAFLLLAFYLGAWVYFWANQVEKVLAPTAFMPSSPKRMGFEAEPVEIPIPGEQSPTSVPAYWVASEGETSPVFLYLHGQDATIGKNLEHTQRLRRMGFRVLVVEYRGYGTTYGEFTPHETTVYEDAEAAWEYLTTELGESPDNIFIYGHSLGGAVAINLAKEHPEAAGLVTVGTFTSILDVSKTRYRGLLRLLPVTLLLRERFDSIDKIGSLKLPILLIHGTADEKVPFEMSMRLYEAAQEPKELLLIEDGGHATSGSIGWVEFRDTLTAFVDRCDSR